MSTPEAGRLSPSKSSGTVEGMGGVVAGGYEIHGPSISCVVPASRQMELPVRWMSYGATRLTRPGCPSIECGSYVEPPPEITMFGWAAR